MTEEVMPKVGKKPWQTLYLSADVRPHRLGMWCALPDEEAAAKAHDSWDLMIGDGKPGLSQSWTAGTGITIENRFQAIAVK